VPVPALVLGPSTAPASAPAPGIGPGIGIVLVAGCGSSIVPVSTRAWLSPWTLPLRRADKGRVPNSREHMALIVYDLTLEMLRHIKPIIDKMARHDRNLADHMQRSAQQSFLNIAEAQSARGRNEVAKFRLHPTLSYMNSVRPSDQMPHPQPRGVGCT